MSTKGVGKERHYEKIVELGGKYVIYFLTESRIYKDGFVSIHCVCNLDLLEE